MYLPVMWLTVFDFWPPNDPQAFQDWSLSSARNKPRALPDVAPKQPPSKKGSEESAVKKEEN